MKNRAMNKNMFQTLSMITMLVGFELVQGGSGKNNDQTSYPVSNFIKAMNSTNWGWDSKLVATSNNKPSGSQRYTEFTDYAKQQSKESAENLAKLELARKYQKANDALVVKLKKDIEMLDANLQNDIIQSRYENQIQFEAGYDSQELKDLFKEIKQSYQQYIEGFKVLGQNENDLLDFMKEQFEIEHKKFGDDEFVEGAVLEAVESYIADEIEYTFIGGLQEYNPNFIDRLDVKKIHKMADLSPHTPLENLVDDKDPIVQYAMKYKDSCMKNVIDVLIRKWIVQTIPIEYYPSSEEIDLDIEESAEEDHRIMSSLLYRAIMVNNIDLIKILIDLKIYDARILRQSLSFLINSCNLSTIEIFLDKGVEHNGYIWKLANSGNKVNAKIMELLIQAGVTPEDINDAGPIDGRIDTPLMNAAIYDNVPCVRALISAGADIDCQDHNGLTALHRAVEVHAIHAARALLEAGANPNIRDDEGRLARDNAFIPEMEALFTEYPAA